MMKLLIAMDGSEVSLRALQFAIKQTQGLANAQINLINVQDPTPPHIAAKSGMTTDDWLVIHQEAGNRMLEPATAALRAAGVHYSSSVAVGAPAEEVVRRANELGCDQIVMGTRGMSAIAGLLMGSVATRVVHLAHCPVTLVK